MLRLATSIAAFLVLASPVAADTIKLQNGSTLEGVILKEESGEVVIRLKYGTVTVNRAEIASIEKSAPPAGEGPGRIAGWEKCYEVLATRPWTKDLHPVPAMVIDKGTLKNVPYVASRAGDRQFNVYGDLDHPADLEIGLTRDSLKLTAAREECIAVLSQMLSDPKDVETLRSLDFKKDQDKKERAGLVFEIEREADADGNDTWWLSVVDAAALDKARLSDKEIEAMTAPVPAEKPVTPAASTPAASTPVVTGTKPAAPAATTPAAKSKPSEAGMTGRRSYSRGRSYRPRLPKGFHPPGMPGPMPKPGTPK
jgi:hypothetical protein